MASQGVAKRGNTHRVFSRRDLAKFSVTGPLQLSGESLPDCLDELVRKRLLARRGRDGFAATSDGNVVKHNFNQLDRRLRANAPVRNRQLRDPQQMALLRERMRLLCAERQGRGPGSRP
jgi:hypothetical protein